MLSGHYVGITGAFPLMRLYSRVETGRKQNGSFRNHPNAQDYSQSLISGKRRPFTGALSLNQRPHTPSSIKTQYFLLKIQFVLIKKKSAKDVKMIQQN